jgi:hypothetical protein
MEEETYKGYTIKAFEDGTFDIEDDNGSLIDGGFKDLHECKAAIDEFAT